MDKLFMFEISGINGTCVGQLVKTNPLQMADVVVIKPVLKNLLVSEDLLNHIYNLPPNHIGETFYFSYLFIGSNTTLWPIPDINYQQWLNFIKNIRANQK